MLLGDVMAQDCPDGTIGVDDWKFEVDFFSRLDGFAAARQQFKHIEGLFQTVVLRDGAMSNGIGGWPLGGFEDGGQIESVGFPVFDGLIDFQAIGATDHFVDRAEAERSHDFACIFSDHEEVVDNMFGFASELCSQFGVLGCDPDGAGI